jgi:uncharacterized protein (TIGR02646 family)
MHWVDRGSEPEGLATVRSRYTARWVEYYRKGTGSKPSDSRWRNFRDDLSRVFFDLCAYCEELSRGEVEHFRPKSRFPELVYQWSNWVFACHDCNHAKGEQWASGGYANPCARSRPARPENFFDFDTLTGELLPKSDLSRSRRSKAQRMIDDLRLNEIHHLRKRRERLWLVSEVLSTDSDDQDPDFRNILTRLAARSTELSSITRTWLVEHGYPVNF